MSRYVDIDRLKPQQFENSEVELGVLAYDYEVVQSEPYIDIVRCEECKYYAEHNELYINAPTNCVKHSTLHHYVVVNADDFCSYGERNTNEN